MNISMIAKLKTLDDFFANYSVDDYKREFDGINLLFYGITNNNLEARYGICKFLLSKGANATEVNSSNESLLHLLFGKNKHNIELTFDLCEI